ncbi:hypothetical protein [uncultured Alistipes sp.]|uniref:hypothetical protein n=1 Tax=uncultured Alistipes sp. TaxID=538949 RepID=UPI00258D344E|nr:hypothetical protein [uncultured Alistipes sp.]
MTLKSYLRMLLAAVTLLFVTSGCNDDDNKVGPPPSYSFSVAVSDVAQTEATVTVTPSNDQATYYYAAVKKAEFDTFESDAAYAQHILDNLKAIADKKVLPLSEYLATALVKGSAPQKITDLTAGTDYYAVALGMLTDGRFTSDLVKEAFKTDDAPEPELVISKAGGYFFGTSFGAFDNFTFWMSEDTVTEDMMDFTGEGTYLLFDLNVTVTGKATLPAGTFPVASGADAEENTIAPGADYGGGMMTGSAIVKINSDGTKNYLYIDGGALIVEGAGSSYVITAKVTSGGKEYEFKYEGGVSIYDTTGGGGEEGPELTLTMSAGDPEGNNLSSAVTCVIQSPTAVSGKGGLYLKANVDKALAEGTTIEEYLASDTKASTFEGRYIELINGAGLPFYAGGLTPSLAVTAIISVTDANGKTTVKSASATTASDGGETGDGPELTLTLRAGDANGANTDTKVYMGAYAPTATGAYYGVFLTSDVEKVLAQGASYDAIVTQNGTDMSTKDGWLDGLVQNPGIGVTFSGLDPATSYTCILKVTDSAGKSTTKHVAATTEGGGEASDAYKAWLGTWTLTSTSSEVNAAPLSFDVTFIQGVANSSYKLQGWGITTIRDQSQILPLAKFDSATGNFEILEGQSLYTDPEDGSVLTLTGRALLQGKYYIINGGYPGFTGKLNADKNSATITLYQGSVEGMGNFTTSSMDFFWVLGQDIYWQKAAEGYTDKDYPIGPYTMTRKSSGASVAASKSAATILHASKLSSVLSGCTVLSTSVKQNGVVFESQVAMPSSLVFDRPAAVYEASVGNVANIKKPLGLKKHFIKK